MHVNTSTKCQLEHRWILMNAISEIKSNIKQIDEIGLTVENLLGVRVELMA